MKKVLSLILALVMCLALCACGGKSDAETEKKAPETTKETVKEKNSTEEVTTEEPTPEPPAPERVMESGSISIDAVCVDDSYRDDDNSPLRMVYLFYTVTATESNLKADSKYTKFTIGGNSYDSDFYKGLNKYALSYNYSSYIEDVYIGTSFKVVTTVKIPEGDLVDGKKVALSDSQYPDMANIYFKTEDIKHFESDIKIAEVADPEGYSTEMNLRADAPADVEYAVKNYINGRYWSFYVNNTYYKLEFWADCDFNLITAYVTNSGTYSVKNGYIYCTYPSNGYTVEIPYERMEDGSYSLNPASAFSVYE